MNIRRTIKKELNLNKPSLKKNNLNQSSTGCVPCLSEVYKIDRQVNKRQLNEIKIEEIKRIVRSIFQSHKNDIKKN